MLHVKLPKGDVRPIDDDQEAEHRERDDVGNRKREVGLSEKNDKRINDDEYDPDFRWSDFEIRDLKFVRRGE